MSFIIYFVCVLLLLLLLLFVYVSVFTLFAYFKSVLHLALFWYRFNSFCSKNENSESRISIINRKQTAKNLRRHNFELDTAEETVRNWQRNI